MSTVTQEPTPAAYEELLLSGGDAEYPALQMDDQGRTLIPRVPTWRPGVHLNEYVAIWPMCMTPRTRSHRHGRLVAHIRIVVGGKVIDLGLRRIELVHWIIALAGSIGRGWVVGQVAPMKGHGAQLTGIPRRRE
ncbi:hypothetical protein [Streptomyces sp. NPDC047974]|uniref:hypothetical protein n=1 Tax=Streptomyces sp. NPDC047974 TaxID=3154343 RepID=UPI0033CE3580